VSERLRRPKGRDVAGSKGGKKTTPTGVHAGDRDPETVVLFRASRVWRRRPLKKGGGKVREEWKRLGMKTAPVAAACNTPLGVVMARRGSGELTGKN